MGGVCGVGPRALASNLEDGPHLDRQCKSFMLVGVYRAIRVSQPTLGQASGKAPHVVLWCMYRAGTHVLPAANGVYVPHSATVCRGEPTDCRGNAAPVATISRSPPFARC